MTKRKESTIERHRQALEKVYKMHGRPLTRTEWDRLGISPKSRTIVMSFGSWDKAWEDVGIKDFRDLIFAQRTIETMKKVYHERRGKTIGKGEWARRRLKPGIAVIERVFGSWEKAWMAAVGVKPPRSYYHETKINRALRSFEPRLLTLIDSDFERRVADLVRDGYTFTEIGKKMYMTTEGVRVCVRRIFTELARIQLFEQNTLFDDGFIDSLERETDRAVALLIREGYGTKEIGWKLQLKTAAVRESVDRIFSVLTKRRNEQFC